MTSHEQLMKQCIKLARKGCGNVSPNPLVGCIIIKNGKIIGKGYHKKYGEAHAEVNAINDAMKNGYEVEGADVYVNLEPCSHKGKTNPCSELLIKKKVSKVIIGMKDPYEKVNGRGIKKLKESGIEVVTGILEEECKELNKFFIKFVNVQLPYVTLKIAQSIDGKIALNNYKSQWITGEASRKYVHQMRSEYDAVMIGKNTAMTDNPSLTVRDNKGRNPFRIIIDKDNSLPDNLKLFTDKNKDRTFIITDKLIEEGNTKKRNIIICKKNKNGLIDIKDLLKKLYQMNIASVMIEGGANLFSQFIEYNLFDDAYFFIAPKIIGKGISAFCDYEINDLAKAGELKIVSTKMYGNDMLIYSINKSETKL